MWVSPNHPNPPRQPTPPADTGRRLATIPRGDGREELRVSLAEFNGHPFVALRVWQRDASGQWWPTRKGFSIRLSEAREVADTLAEALALTRF
jgi:hypothetical protein